MSHFFISLIVSFALFFFSSTLSLFAHAGQPYITSGSGLTLGHSSSEYYLHASSFNPAMADLLVADDEKWRLGFLPSVSTEIELGQVENFGDDLEELIDIIDNPSLVTGSVNETLDRFNAVLREMGQEGYLKNTSSVRLPLFYRRDFLGGTLSADFRYAVQAAARVLDAPLSFNNQNTTFSTSTAIYLKSGIEKEWSLGYGRPVYQIGNAESPHAKIYFGGRVSAISMDLSKQALWLEGVQNEELSDIVRDEYDKHLVSNSAVNLDVGLVWSAANYRLGLTLSHLNSPSFDYNSVGVDCDNQATSVDIDNCYNAQNFIVEGRLKSQETHEMKPITTADALLKITDRWILSGSYDLAQYDDIVGFENQHLHLATAYEPSGYWWPASRIGYSKNVVGAELTSVNVGLTFFGFLSLDVVYGQETTVVDGDEYPRKIGFSLGFEEKF
jgi:F plasmid transfer operon, TraF, protein